MILQHSKRYLKSLRLTRLISLPKLFSTDSIKQVHLDKFHRQTLKATMTTFAGYSLPIKYKGMLDEQKACRNSAALFDVSHMGPAIITGHQAAKLIQSKMVVDLTRLKSDGDAAYSLITNDKFGIVDDAVISKLSEDQYYIVFNGARKDVDKAYFQQTSYKANIKMMDQENCLLALQGPQAERVLNEILPQIRDSVTRLKFMQTFRTSLKQKSVIISRCGYTGEDGFQVLIPNSEAQGFCMKLLESGKVQPAGLGARDILRTQAGLCLYGQDIDQQTTPVEAGLLFTISKRRRQEGGFPGFQTFNDQFKNKSFSKKRVGFLMEDQKHLKPGHKILSEKSFDECQKLIVGSVTSGTFSPTIGKGIGMGYVMKQFDKAETSLYARISKSKAKRLDIKKMPLLPSKIKK